LDILSPRGEGNISNKPSYAIVGNFFLALGGDDAQMTGEGLL
jgi:hypothetical protein